MFSILALFVAACMAVFAVALPHPWGEGINDSCNTGTVHCCDTSQNAVQNAEYGSFPGFFHAVGAVIPVAATCSPLGLGITSQSCTAQTACCQNNNFNGVIVLACNPINVNVL